MRTWSPPDHQPFSGRYVSLKPFDAKEEDVKALFEISHGTKEKEAVWDYLYYGPFRDNDEMRDWYRNELLTQPDILPWLILDRASKAVLGFTALMSIVPKHGRAEIGHVWLTPSAHRSKTNTEAQYLLLSHVFDTCGYRRVEWRCNSRNHASRTAASRLGFLFEGRFRKHMFLKGANRDTDWFAMTDSDWARAGGNIRKYLEATVPVSLMDLNTR